MAMSGPIRFEWRTAGGELLSTRGMTRDVSSSGIYCYIDHPLAAGLEVEFDVLFPEELTGGEPMTFRCRGRVQRTEKLRTGFGVPVSIQSRHLIETGGLHRRGYNRASLHAVAEYSGVRASIRDLSLSGTFIEDYNPLPVGHKIKLHLTCQELPEEILVEGTVRRVVPHVGMAVEFVALSANAGWWLRELMKRSAKPE